MGTEHYVSAFLFRKGREEGREQKGTGGKGRRKGEREELREGGREELLNNPFMIEILEFTYKQKEKCLILLLRENHCYHLDIFLPRHF